MTIEEFGTIETEVTMTVEALANARTRTTIVETGSLDDLSPEDIGFENTDHGVVISSVVSRSNKAYDVKTTVYETQAEEDEGTITITSTASEEPIETHPAFTLSSKLDSNYLYTLAGTGDDPELGAIFEGTTADAKFSHFSHENERDLAGVESYLVPSVVAEVTKVLPNTANFVFQNVYDVGRIKAPPQNISVGDRTWLVIGAQYRLVDGSWEATVQYQLSGEKGWNEALYLDAQ